VFTGQGLIPESYSPLADSIPEENLIAQMQEFRSDIRDRAEEMLPHDRFIDRYCSAQSAAEARS
jgi:tryptophan halogenase